MAKSKRAPRRGKAIRLWAAIVLAVVAIGVGAVYAFNQYRTFGIAQAVRQSFAALEYEAGRESLSRWLKARPNSGEAQYYRAWDALARNEPREAVEAVDQARKLGYDSDRLDCLSAIYHARADRYSQAEPASSRHFWNRPDRKKWWRRNWRRFT